MTPPAMKSAPEAVQGFEGNDQDTYQGEPIAMKTTAPRVAQTPDNMELATSSQSVLAKCGDESCAYFHQGHYAAKDDPQFMHRFLRVVERDFSVAIDRMSTDDEWGLYIEVKDGELTAAAARDLAHALKICSDTTDALNAERRQGSEVSV